MLVLYFSFAFILICYFFEYALIKSWRYFVRRLYRCCGKCMASINSREYVESEPEKFGFVFSDDLFCEFNYLMLYKKYE
jgi:hypothetical protein